MTTYDHFICFLAALRLTQEIANPQHRCSVVQLGTPKTIHLPRLLVSQMPSSVHAFGKFITFIIYLFY